MALTLLSDDFQPDSGIPARHTCDGENVSPSLSWSNAPSGTRSFALIVDDPDAPDPAAPTVRWVHWVLYNIPPQISHLAAGVRESELPGGTEAGLNDWKNTRYGGPCPPVGRHRYVHTLYALDTALPDLRHPPPGPSRAGDAGARAGAGIVGRHLPAWPPALARTVLKHRRPRRS